MCLRSNEATVRGNSLSLVTIVASLVEYGVQKPVVSHAYYCSVLWRGHLLRALPAASCCLSPTAAGGIWRTLCSTSPELKLPKLAAGLCDPEGVGRVVRQHVEYLEGDGHSKRVSLFQARTGMVSSHHCPVVKLRLPPNSLPLFVDLQEADLQRYRSHLISMGKIENAAGANLKPRRHKTFEESIKAFEVGHVNLPYKTFTDTNLQSCSSSHTVTCCRCSPSARRPVKISVSKFDFAGGAGLT